jgi:hypothetical protein
MARTKKFYPEFGTGIRCDSKLVLNGDENLVQESGVIQKLVF